MVKECGSIIVGYALKNIIMDSELKRLYLTILTIGERVKKYEIGPDGEFCIEFLYGYWIYLKPTE